MFGQCNSWGMVVYTGDCFPAMQSLVKMKGTPAVFPEVRELYLFAAEHDVHVEFAWMPRTAEWLQHADELSLLPDSSELFIRPAQLRLVCTLMFNGVSWGWPTLDVFAGAASGQHTASKFYSLYYAPGCIGVNGLHQNWYADAQVQGYHSLVWLFPPFSLIGAALKKLCLERVNAILIAPKYVRYWVSLLKQLPVVARHDLGFHRGLFTVGSKAPVQWRQTLPRIPLMAYLIKFY